MTLQRLRTRLKALQRWFLFSAYAEEELKRGWQAIDSNAPMTEELLAPRIGTVGSLCVFKPDDLGDLVCSLPAISQLRQLYPQAQLTWLCQKPFVGLVRRLHLADTILGVEVSRRTWGYRKVATPLGTLPRFDLAVFLRTYPDYFKDFLKIEASHSVHPRDPRMPSRSFFQRTVSLWGKERKHQVLQLLEILQILEPRVWDWPDITFPTFHWEDEDRQQVEKAIGQSLPPRYWVLHAYAAVDTRQYPYWKDFGRLLWERFQFPIYCIGGPQDPQCEVPGGISLVGKLNWEQTGYLISRATGFLGNLSGPAHLSGALGIPTLVVASGHSSSREWSPLGNTLLVRMQAHCAPCHLSHCEHYDLACLRQMAAERVWERVLPFFDRAINRR